jgi:hypothetical protein
MARTPAERAEAVSSLMLRTVRELSRKAEELETLAQSDPRQDPVLRRMDVLAFSRLPRLTACLKSLRSVAWG